jgi:hypothetical protein
MQIQEVIAKARVSNFGCSMVLGVELLALWVD